jgi:hypothetical protein
LAPKTEILLEIYARFRSAILSGGGDGFVPPESKGPSCIKKPGFFAALALLFCLVLIAPASAREWHIDRFYTQMSVAPDGVVDVTERLDVVLDGVFHGIYRDIPIEYPGPHSSKYTLFLTVTGVTDGAGNDLKYDSTTQHGYRHLTIYIPDAVNATRTVEIHYTVTNAVRWFDDHDELYWNVTGYWQVPIDSASTHIVFPANAKGELRAQAFTGQYGSRAQDANVQVGDNAVSVATYGPLSEREGLTADVYIPKGVLTQPSSPTAGHLVPAIPPEARLWEEAAADVMIASVVVIVVWRSLWRDIAFWMALILSSAIQLAVVHAWVQRAGELSRSAGKLATFLGTALFFAIYSCIRLLRRNFYGEGSSESR